MPHARDRRVVLAAILALLVLAAAQKRLDEIGAPTMPGRLPDWK